MIFFDAKTTYSKNNMPFIFELLNFNFNTNDDRELLRFNNAQYNYKILLGMPDDDKILSSSLAFTEYNSINDIVNNKNFINNYKVLIEQLHTELSKDKIIVSYNGDDTLLNNLNCIFEKYNLNKINFNSLDLLKIIRKKIDINEVGNTLLLTILIYLFPNNVQKIKTIYNTHRFVFLIEKLFQKLINNYNIKSLQECFDIINTPIRITNFQFGKYKGYSIADIAKKDPQYLSWIYNNEEIHKKFPDLFYTVSSIKNEDIPNE